MRGAAVPVTADHPVHPYVHLVLVAIIGAVAVLARPVVFDVVNRLPWEEVIPAHPWLFPAICPPFSLPVGWLVEHREAPTTLDEPPLDSLAGDVTKIDWRTLPTNVVMALVRAVGDVPSPVAT